ncbi:hypothetical protein AUC68_11030 [Methyloceanibacter methanicus]|uniref:DUF2946 domain-containing protein n=1 Tax=Methyloceanibacter methanicus TaxID=1774968 RepID=A0A1E3VWX4_9HYPH|nr:DUF2946 family protein [Methyloceanibacter methanicus]ODR98030.1 hypothetical protein AUC68_11030 [Methyloceanibacter methanicus]
MALLGVLLFTALVPGHVVSQATAFAFGDDGLTFEMSCHRGAAMQDAGHRPDTPDTPQKKCPFCKGYAAFMVALAAAPVTAMIDAERVRIATWAMNEGAVRQVAKHTKSRGPPTLL